jgi:hypothetical protein
MSGAFRGADATAPAHGAVAVTPSDVTVIAMCRGLYVGTTGNITVRMADGQDNVLFTAVPVGILPIQVDKVYSTGTTASTIIALY